MRPKFRAYIPKLDIMLYDVDVYANGMIGIAEDHLPSGCSVNHDSGHLSLGDSTTSILTGEDYLWLENGYILMQWTGLRDGGNTEIYRDDIIHLEDISAVIEWDDGGYQMKTSENQGKSMAIQARTSRFRIGGNIHQSK